MKIDKTKSITTDQLRKMLIETDLPRSIYKSNKNLSPKPSMPDNVPQDFAEALFYNDMCAIPLYGDGKWVFMVIGEKGSRIVDQRTGKFLIFSTYMEAINTITKIKRRITEGTLKW